MWSMARVSAVLLILFIQTVTWNSPAEAAAMLPLAAGMQKPSEAPASELICGRSHIQIGLRLINMEFYGLNGSSGHLADPRCSSLTEQNRTVWYQVERQADTCGNLLTTNSTHAIYSNTLFVYHANDFSPPVSYPFSCAYPLNIPQTSSQAIRPDLQADPDL